VKDISTKTLVRVILVTVMISLAAFAGWDVYRRLSLAAKPDEVMIQSYQLTINVKAVKQAAELLSE
jgi:hypothetical protein